MKLVLDFESASAINIQDCGAYVYAAHPSTDVLCLAVKPGTDRPFLWTPDSDPAEVFYALKHCQEAESHNADFERQMWRYVMRGKYGWPELPEEKLRCSMAKAAMHALPRGLGDLCFALGLPPELSKDAEGKSLIKKLCIPRTPKASEWAELEAKFSGSPLWGSARAAYLSADKNKLWAYLAVLTNNWQPDFAEALLWNREPEDMQKLYRYCLQDVEAEAAVSAKLHDLPDGELEVWRLDQKINARGIRIDREGAASAIRMVSVHSTKLTEELVSLTNGMVRTAKQNAVLIAWAKTRGVELPNLTKATVQVYLKREGLDPDVKRMLEIRASLNRASTAKYKTALQASSTDGKLRGWAGYHGAATGRWTSNLIQLHNMPRGRVKLNNDDRVTLGYLSMAQGADVAEMLYGDPVELASSAIRGMLVADPGHVLYASDFSSVEARALAWLAGDVRALSVFHQKQDPYKVAADGIFNVGYANVDKKQRQVGKVSELAFGYGGGIGAYASMAKVYDIDLETLPPFIMPHASGHEREQAERTAQSYLKDLDNRIKHGIGNATELDRMSLEAATACDVIKQKWRKNRPVTVAFWKELGEAALLSVLNPGRAFTVGNKISYCVQGHFLLCRLPSGRVLFYYKPSIKKVTKFGKQQDVLHYWGMKALDGGGQKYQQVQTYGPKLAENCFTRDALVVTHRGVLPIVEVRAGDFVWDGVEWVATGGPVERGKKEVVEWLGILVTPDHLTTDGRSWKSVTASVEGFTQGALSWALSSVRSPSFQQPPASTVKPCADASAEGKPLNRLTICMTGEPHVAVSAETLRAEQRAQSETATRTSYPTPFSCTCGGIGIAGWCQDALTQRTKRTPTTAAEESACSSGGLMTEKTSTGTSSPCRVGTSQGSTSTDPTTKGITALGTSDLSNGRSTPEINATTPSLSATEKKCPSPSSGGVTAQNGAATTVSSTTCFKDAGPKKSWRYTGKVEAVYDLLNCGPRSRFTVLTDRGPVVVHNCTQAACACLLRAAMLRVEAAGYPVVLHVHDEAVAQRLEGEGNLEEFNTIMAEVPAWAEGLPMGAAGWVGRRYRKD